MTGDPISGIEPDTPPVSSGLADLLLPLVQQACDGRLREIEAFSVSWQHGGARTARGVWAGEGGRTERVVIKVPVGPRELRWTRDLDDGRDDQPTPRVYASGETLGPHDLGWIVEEDLGGPPVGRELDESVAMLVLEATQRFQARAEVQAPPSEAPHPRPPDWDTLLGTAREHLHAHEVPDGKRWATALKRLEKALPLLQARWACRPMDTWCHGDLHGGNVLRRTTPDGATVGVLIDLALVHPGCWIEDAVYLERQYWGHKASFGGVKPVTVLARLRRDAGLAVGPDSVELAHIRRVLAAASTLPYHARVGDQSYLAAALAAVESGLSVVA